MAAQLDAGLTGDQEVAGSTLAGSPTFFHEDFIIKYFLRSFSPLDYDEDGYDDVVDDLHALIMLLYCLLVLLMA